MNLKDIAQTAIAETSGNESKNIDKVYFDDVVYPSLVSIISRLGAEKENEKIKDIVHGGIGDLKGKTRSYCLETGIKKPSDVAYLEDCPRQLLCEVERIEDEEALSPESYLQLIQPKVAWMSWQAHKNGGKGRLVLTKNGYGAKLENPTEGECVEEYIEDESDLPDLDSNGEEGENNGFDTKNQPLPVVLINQDSEDKAMTLEEHDRWYHEGAYKPGQKCEFRERLAENGGELSDAALAEANSIEAFRYYERKHEASSLQDSLQKSFPWCGKRKSSSVKVLPQDDNGDSLVYFSTPTDTPDDKVTEESLQSALDVREGFDQKNDGTIEGWKVTAFKVYPSVPKKGTSEKSKVFAAKIHKSRLIGAVAKKDPSNNGMIVMKSPSSSDEISEERRNKILKAFGMKVVDGKVVKRTREDEMSDRAKGGMVSTTMKPITSFHGEKIRKIGKPSDLKGEASGDFLYETSEAEDCAIYEYLNLVDGEKKNEEDVEDQDTEVGDSFVEAAVLIYRVASRVNGEIECGDQQCIDTRSIRDAEIAFAFVQGMNHGLAIDDKMMLEYIDYEAKAIQSLRDSRENGFQSPVYVPPNPFEIFNISARDFKDNTMFLHCFGNVVNSKRNTAAKQKETDEHPDGQTPYCRHPITGEPTSVGIGSDSHPGFNDPGLPESDPPAEEGFEEVVEDALIGEPLSLRQILGTGDRKKFKLAVAHRLGISALQAELLLNASWHAQSLGEELFVDLTKEYCKDNPCFHSVVNDDNCLYVNLNGDVDYVNGYDADSEERKNFEQLKDDLNTISKLCGVEGGDYTYEKNGSTVSNANACNYLYYHVDDKSTPIFALCNIPAMEFYKYSNWWGREYAKQIPELSSPGKVDGYLLPSEKESGLARELREELNPDEVKAMDLYVAAKSYAIENAKRDRTGLINGKEMAEKEREYIDKYMKFISPDRESDAEDEWMTASILVTSDIHTSGIKDIDTTGSSMVIIAGDIMGAGMDSDDAGFRYLEEEFFPWCEKNSDKEIVITAGNHDKFLFRMWKQGHRISWPKNVHYLIDRAKKVRGIKFYGTPWCTKNREGRFEASDMDLFKKFKKIPDGLDILIAHTPPYIPGEKIDMPCGYGEWHDGSKELTEEILKKKPRLVICGHVHGGDRTPIMLGESKIMNVARVKSDRSKEYLKPHVIRFEYEK